MKTGTFAKSAQFWVQNMGRLFHGNKAAEYIWYFFYLLQVSLPVNTWLLFKVEEESMESRQLLCGILAQEFLSGVVDGEPGSVKCIKYNTKAIFFAGPCC